MISTKAEQASAYRSIQVLVLVFSFIFFFVISYGYFNLFLKAGAFLALAGGFIMAVFAWYLARVMGSSVEGVRKNFVLFLPLVVVSSAGVYNSLMLYLEGGTIIADSANQSQQEFQRLQAVAESGLASSGAAKRINRVNSLSESLYSEIRNPLNCGQGPEARRLIAELQREIPGFTSLSSPGKHCDKNEEIISDYKERIPALLARAPWNNPDLLSVIQESEKSRDSLSEIRTAATTNYSPTSLQPTLNRLEGQDVVYRNMMFKASRHVDVRDLSPGLPIASVQSLGNAFKLPQLFFDRLNEVSTYAYLLIAVGFDAFMVYLFVLARSNRTRRVAAGNVLSGAW